MTCTYTPAPNPEVYRIAASLLSDSALSDSALIDSAAYSCLAIKSACAMLFLGYGEASHYLAQYENTFGPNHSAKLHVDAWGELRHPNPNGDIYHINSAISEAAIKAHPFWSQSPNDERREYRILALLFMAELVENP